MTDGWLVEPESTLDRRENLAVEGGDLRLFLSARFSRRTPLRITAAERIGIDAVEDIDVSVRDISVPPGDTSP